MGQSDRMWFNLEQTGGVLVSRGKEVVPLCQFDSGPVDFKCHAGGRSPQLSTCVERVCTRFSTHFMIAGIAVLGGATSTSSIFQYSIRASQLGK